MGSINPLDGLVQQLCKLPGIGPKSALRLAFFFMTLPKNEVANFSGVLSDIREKIRNCEKCFNISITEQCYICNDITRENDKLCVVAEPRDVFALERTGQFKGLYHVLGGLLSPIDGIHPETLRIPELLKRLRAEPVSEVIFAINPNIEGDATLLYLTKLLSSFDIKKTKLAHGLSVGSDIDYADEMTLHKAFMGRRSLEFNQ
jgi:recombination protein RecR